MADDESETGAGIGGGGEQRGLRRPRHACMAPFLMQLLGINSAA